MTEQPMRKVVGVEKVEELLVLTLSFGHKNQAYESGYVGQYVPCFQCVGKKLKFRNSRGLLTW